MQGCAEYEESFSLVMLTNKENKEIIQGKNWPFEASYSINVSACIFHCFWCFLFNQSLVNQFISVMQEKRLPSVSKVHV